MSKYDKMTVDQLKLLAEECKEHKDTLKQKLNNNQKKLNKILSEIEDRVKIVTTVSITPIDANGHNDFLNDLGAINILISEKREDRPTANIERSVPYFYLNGHIHHCGGGKIILCDSLSDDYFIGSNKIPATQEDWDSILSGKIPYHLLTKYYQMRLFPEKGLKK